MTKPWLHIHSDCPRAGGSENMPFTFLRSRRVNEEFDVSFTYRHSKEYVEGMETWVGETEALCRGLHLPAGWINRMGNRWAPFKALRYPAMLYEVALLADIFRNEQPDVLHVNNGGYPGATSCNSAVIAARIAGVPRVTYTVNSTARDLWWERPITWLMRWSVTYFISASAHLMRNSRHLWKREYWDMAQGSGLDDSNWKTIPNTVLFQTTPAPETVRKHLGIHPTAFLFVVAGADEPRKGRDVFTKALFEVDKDHNVQGWMSDPEDNRGLNDYDLINAADCLVVPSLCDEDFPNVILIAMMYGKPVIASDVGGVSEMVENGKTGFLVEPGSVKYLTMAMRDILKAIRPFNSHSWGSGGLLGMAGKEKFDRLYSEDTVIPQYISLWKGE